MRELEIVDDLRLHSNRLSVGGRAGPEASSLERVVQTAVVTAVARRREFPVDDFARLVDVEFGHEMEATKLGRKRQRRDEQLDCRRRVVRLNTTARSGAGP